MPRLAVDVFMPQTLLQILGLLWNAPAPQAKLVPAHCL